MHSVILGYITEETKSNKYTSIEIKKCCRRHKKLPGFSTENLTSLRARFKININILNKNNNENQMGAANLCFSQFTPLGREEVADAITGAWQRCAAEEEDDEDNKRSDGRDPNGLYIPRTAKEASARLSHKRQENYYYY